jgi:twinkle protein
MDKLGDEAAEEIASRLGRHRCYRVSLKHKDANECLMEGVGKFAMDEAIANARSLDPDGLKRPVDYADKVIHLFWPAHDEPPGYTLPYAKVADRFHLRPAEFTLWSGASGAGKSQILSDCIPHWIKQGSRICLASLEMKGEQTLRRMAKQTGGVDRPTAPFIQAILRYLDQGLLLYERVGKAGVGPLLEVFDYARAKYGCDQFVVDSLMRLGIAQDDYNGQEKAVFQIVDWTIRNNVHTHMVAHARKSGPGQSAPVTEDIKGTMEIGANAFNILTVWRDRKHEEAMAAAKSDDERRDLEQKPGVVLNIAKQRNGDFEGKVGLWFSQPTYQYHSAFDRSIWRRSYVSLSDSRGEAAA